MRYQYTSKGAKENLNQNLFNISNGVKILVIINIIVFLLTEISGEKHFIYKSFGLLPRTMWSNYKFWQLCTYLFLHGGFLHILFNMFVLWIFGKDLEAKWGKNEFLKFYFSCGIGSGFITSLVGMNSIIPIVGASGAIYGVLVAYGFTYPNRIVYLYGLFPIKVKYMVFALSIFAFFASISENQTNVSHITHLSGIVIGLLILYFKYNLTNIKLLYYKFQLKKISIQPNKKKLIEIEMKKKMDKILDKINNDGWESLTTQEEKYLNNVSKKLFKNFPPS